MADEVFERALHAMTDVQRRSVEAASALVERLVASVDGHRASDGEHATTDAPSSTDDVIAGFARLWRDSVTSLVGAVPGGRDAEAAPYLDVTEAGAPASLQITLDAATRTGAIEVWLHNPSIDSFDKLRVHFAAPQAHDGSTIDIDALVANPDAFDLPARASRGIEITIDAAEAAAGTYRTLVLVEGLPDQWLPLEISVPELPE